MTHNKDGYLGLDMGATGVKAGVFDLAGRTLAMTGCRIHPRAPGPGMAEIPISEIHAAARTAVRSVVRESGARVRALAVSSQGQTFVSLDAKDKPLHPAIMWYDTRAAHEASALDAAVKRGAGRGVELPVVNEYCSAAKILWLRKHRPAVMRRAVKYLLLPEYINYTLTGLAVTDPCTARSAGLIVDGRDHWHSRALDAAGIPEGHMARVQRTATPVGRVRAEAAREWGLPAGALVVTGTNDQYCGAIGAGNVKPGILSETSGTCLAGVILARTLPELPPGLYHGHFPDGRHKFILVFAKTSGLVSDWFRDRLCPDKTFAELDAAAAAVPPGCRGLTHIPHFEGAVSPRPNPAARGAFVGLDLHHGVADMFRAVLEGLTFNLQESIIAIRKTGLRPRIIRSLGGGAKSDFWLQMKADVTGLAVERPMQSEAASFGAALIAMTGAGKFGSINEAGGSLYRAGRTFEPDRRNRAAYRAAYERFVRLEQMC